MPGLSSASSTPFATSSTTSGLTKGSRTRPRPPSINTPLGPIPSGLRRWNTPATSRSAASVETAASAGRKVGSTSAPASSSRTSAWKRSTTASGPSTSAPSCSAGSTKTTSSSTELDLIDRTRSTAYGRLRKSLRDYAQSPTGLLLLLLLRTEERRTRRGPQSPTHQPSCVNHVPGLFCKRSPRLLISRSVKAALVIAKLPKVLMRLKNRRTKPKALDVARIPLVLGNIDQIADI